MSGPSSEHLLASFDTDLVRLRLELIRMAGLAERQFRSAVQAAATCDAGLAAEVLATEREINALQVALDEACNRVIVRQQPAAVDLREVLAVLHAVGDLERIGDEAKKIAMKRFPTDPQPDAGHLQQIVRMGELAAGMLVAATDAFARRDASAALDLALRDDAVDALRDAVVGSLVAQIEASPERSARLLDLVLMAQGIERVADHAEDIGGYVVHVVEGVDVRHHGSGRRGRS
jgi:phosphate transport system protein